jgi:hypothetical protein
LAANKLPAMPSKPGIVYKHSFFMSFPAAWGTSLWSRQIDERSTVNDEDRTIESGG